MIEGLDPAKEGSLNEFLSTLSNPETETKEEKLSKLSRIAKSLQDEGRLPNPNCEEAQDWCFKYLRGDLDGKELSVDDYLTIFAVPVHTRNCQNSRCAFLTSWVYSKSLGGVNFQEFLEELLKFDSGNPQF